MGLLLEILAWPQCCNHWQVYFSLETDPSISTDMPSFLQHYYKAKCALAAQAHEISFDSSRRLTIANDTLAGSLKRTPGIVFI
jgi:hypothetical protein